jgi:DNA-binding protein HU-beta
MKKSDIINHLSKSVGMSVKSARECFDIIFECIIDNVQKENVTIIDFGRFEVKTRKGKMARNPQTGETFSVPDRDTIIFKTATSLKKKINKNKRGE